MARDHGGNADVARSQYGGDDWIDLSTGINRRPWPVPALPDSVWRDLPTAEIQAQATKAAAAWFGCRPEQVLPMAGASAAIQLLPRLGARGRAAVLSPSYNEHTASLSAAGWQVGPATDTAAMEGADLAVVVNPNNPDGREWSPDALARLATGVGRLIVDESFADPRPDLSLAPALPANAVVLRSFGKFWGLAGLRLGFVIGAPDLLEELREAAGPWSVNGPALAIATAAMADRSWADDTVGYHSEASLRLDMLAAGAGWACVGGTHLFRLYETPDARAAQDRLARARIWTRRFPYSDRWLRLGIPGNRTEWDRLAAALHA
ncbi:threonine-phosphate decarboxylase CobD [Paracoccus beibuensis]|uniref:threonine-phosphate decarboxylase CobD n=1 Tax=Paracoccus beibuensis TaxID=547602 RepID=UPI0022403172|nr:threonine-phosphate decarboxylase CobD [Paracoccus beibuensis]